MIYTVKNDFFEAKIASAGAELISLKGKDGFEYLWTGDEKYWDGHAPVLFPIVGALRNGRVNIGSGSYEMRQHGFARFCEFSFVNGTETGLSLKLEADEQTKSSYPFDFVLTVSYELTEKGIKTVFAVENRGGETMPFSIGGHPGINLPVNEDARFEDYTLVFEKPEDQKCPCVDMVNVLIDWESFKYELKNESRIPLARELFSNDALIFEGLSSKKVSVVNEKTGKGVTMDISDFPMFAIWSPESGGPFVCLEPWTGCATLTRESDEFEEKKNMIFLKPEEIKKFEFSLEIS